MCDKPGGSWANSKSIKPGSNIQLTKVAVYARFYEKFLKVCINCLIELKSVRYYWYKSQPGRVELHLYVISGGFMEIEGNCI